MLAPDKELRIVRRMDSIRDGVQSVAEFGQEAAAALESLLRVDCVALFTVDEHGQLTADAPVYSGRGTCPGKKTLSALRAQAGKALARDRAFEKTLDSGVLKRVVIQPMALNGEALGVLIAGNRAAGPLGPDTAQALQAAAGIADSAILGLRARERVELALRETSLLYDIDTLRDEHRDTRTFLDAALARLNRDVPVHFAAVALKNQETGRHKVAGTFGSRGQGICDRSVFSLAECVDRGGREDITRCSGAVRWLARALSVGDRHLGVMTLARRKQGFTKAEHDLVCAAAAQIDSAVDALQNWNDLLLRNKELHVLYRIDELRDSLDFHAMLDAVNAELRNSLDAESGFIVLYNDRMRETDLRINGVAGDALAQRIRTLCRRTVRHADLLIANFRTPPARSMIAIPLILRGRIIGVFGAANPLHKNHFDNREERLLRAIGSQADTAIFESMERRHLRSVFDRYVGESVIEEMLARDDQDFLSGKRMNVTVLFADVRGFTRMADRMRDPEKLVRITNTYLKYMTEVILENRGTLDKYIGDAIVAVFGAPVAFDDHAGMAVNTALAMQKKMSTVRRVLTRREGIRNFCIGIGVNTGEAVVGNIGCEKMTDYTVLGHNMNVGSRLCDAARHNQVFISEATHNAVADRFRCRVHHDVVAKGVALPMTVYEVLSAK